MLTKSRPIHFILNKSIQAFHIFTTYLCSFHVARTSILTFVLRPLHSECFWSGQGFTIDKEIQIQCKRGTLKSSSFCHAFITLRLWKNSFVEKVDPQVGCQFLDVAGGTGVHFFVCAKWCCFQTQGNTLLCSTTQLCARQVKSPPPPRGCNFRLVLFFDTRMVFFCLRRCFFTPCFCFQASIHRPLGHDCMAVLSPGDIAFRIIDILEQKALNRSRPAKASWAEGMFRIGRTFLYALSKNEVILGQNFIFFETLPRFVNAFKFA